ncbi:MAG TPA: hypothetical protein ENO02_06280 [Epsilonproteobacteria bacterium]|nr:hypothetical protein [Campylobacterota bacterium]
MQAAVFSYSPQIKQSVHMPYLTLFFSKEKGCRIYTLMEGGGMLFTYFKLILSSTVLLSISLQGDNSLENSAEFQKLLAEARKANDVQIKQRELERQKEAEAAKKEALLKIEKEVGKTTFYNDRGEDIERKNIDYIELPVPHINKGHLEFIISYYNRETGDSVNWSNGSAILNCKAYTKNGKLLSSIKHKEVYKSYQKVYVKIGSGVSEGTLKCNVDFLGKTYHDDITFGGFHDLSSPTFSESYKLR